MKAVITMYKSHNIPNAEDGWVPTSKWRELEANKSSMLTGITEDMPHASIAQKE